jgi:hypothetical protein
MAKKRTAAVKKRKSKRKSKREIKVVVAGSVTLDTVEQAIHDKLACEPTDLFANVDTLYLVVQHHVAK